MSQQSPASVFEALVQRPADPGPDDSWAFLMLSKAASDQLPRRGRTTVAGTINGAAFQETLEPDGQLGHWLRVSPELREAAAADFGSVATIEVTPLAEEPDPEVPADLLQALQESPEAQGTWQATTTVARLDWIHWITSAKQEKTRRSRIAGACDMLASGKKRVCCFDPSGFYSKSLSAPKAEG